MEQLNKLKFLAVIFMMMFSSCNSQEKKIDKNNIETLEQQLTELVDSYVEKIRKEKRNGELVFIYVERGDDEKEDFYKYLFYDSAILNENLELPYKYINKEAEENFVIFFFDKERKVADGMKERLTKDSLWVSSSNIDEMKKYRPVIKIQHSPVWDVFICKEDIKKYDIVESVYGLEEKDKITEICN